MDKRTQLIAELLSGVLSTGNYSRQAALAVLERTATWELESMKVKQMRNGIYAPPSDPQADLQAARSTSAQVIDQDPQIQAAREANRKLEQQRQANQWNAQVQANFRRLFNTVIIFPDGTKKLAVDNESNRGFIREWAEGERFQDVAEWFTELVKSPIARQQLAWTPYLTPAEKKAQAESNERSKRAYFKSVCQDHGISECTANWSVWNQIHDPVITEQIDGHPVVTDDEGNEYPLVPATDLEKENWEKERFDKHQADLRRMQKANDIQGLRRAAAQERSQQFRNSATLRRDRELASQYAKDQAAGFNEPLPRVFDKKVIYGWDAKAMRDKISRYGASRITARIYNLQSIVDPDSGETIKFEE